MVHHSLYDFFVQSKTPALRGGGLYVQILAKTETTGSQAGCSAYYCLINLISASQAQFCTQIVGTHPESLDVIVVLKLSILGGGGLIVICPVNTLVEEL